MYDEHIAKLEALGADVPERLRQAALLEAVGASARLVEIAARVAATGCLTLENVLVLRDDGINVEGMFRAIRGEQP